MTKIQKMEEQIKEDDKLFKRIKTIIDTRDEKGLSYPEIVGMIRGAMEMADRIKKDD